MSENDKRLAAERAGDREAISRLWLYYHRRGEKNINTAVQAVLVGALCALGFFFASEVLARLLFGLAFFMLCASIRICERRCEIASHDAIKDGDGGAAADTLGGCLCVINLITDVSFAIAVLIELYAFF